jgi:hypothetical protein
MKCGFGYKSETIDECPSCESSKIMRVDLTKKGKGSKGLKVLVCIGTISLFLGVWNHLIFALDILKIININDAIQDHSEDAIWYFLGIDLWIFISLLLVIVGTIKLYQRKKQIGYSERKLKKELENAEENDNLIDLIWEAKHYGFSELSKKAKEKLRKFHWQQMEKPLKVSLLKDIIWEAKQFEFHRILNSAKERLRRIQEKRIKETVLKLGTKFPRLQIIDIAEKTNAEKELIIKTIKDMIQNKEIYAEYFQGSESVAFDQEINIEEIDRLMSSFKDWEKKGMGKKQKNNNS